MADEEVKVQAQSQPEDQPKDQPKSEPEKREPEGQSKGQPKSESDKRGPEDQPKVQPKSESEKRSPEGQPKGQPKSESEQRRSGSYGNRGPSGNRGSSGNQGPSGNRGGGSGNSYRSSSGGRDGRGDKTSETVEEVVLIRRVSKVVKGGRNIRFNAMVVVGDGKGRVGVALGSAPSVMEAVQKGVNRAKKSMVKVNTKGLTVPYTVVAKFSASKVMLRPAAPGTGIIAGKSVRSVLEAAGIKDILTKRFGSSNPINVVKATIKGLTEMYDPDVEYKRRRSRD